MNTAPFCPKCNSEYTYPDVNNWVCPTCAHEWSMHSEASVEIEAASDNTIKDSNGQVLHDGDAVTVIKELKIKGSGSVVKVGTKVKNIRLVEGHDGHNIACKIDGIGAINLKSEFVRKS